MSLLSYIETINTKRNWKIWKGNDNIVFHETSKKAANIILRDGFKTGKDLKTGEGTHAVFAAQVFDNVSYVRGSNKGVRIPININGLKLLNIDDLPIDKNKKSFEQESYLIKEKVEDGIFPEGYDGVVTYNRTKNKIYECVLKPEIASKRIIKDIENYNEDNIYNEIELGKKDPETGVKGITIQCYDTKDFITAHMYKNPQTIDSMMWFLRGIITRNGDLYVCDYKYSDKGTVIHVNMSEWLKKNEPGYNCNYSGQDGPARYLNEILTVQRVQKTNDFELSESYVKEDFVRQSDPNFTEERKKLLDEYKTNFENKNPRYKLIFKIA